MGTLLTYSGLSAKIRAMQKKFFSDGDFRRMTILASVRDAVTFLSEAPSYSGILAPFSGQDLHRGQIEQLLYISLYEDYSRLYLFSGQEPRRFLKMYFPHFELRLLKRCLRTIFSSGIPIPELPEESAFFQKYSRLSPALLLQCRSPEELAEQLRDTPYRASFLPLLSRRESTLFDYEMILDLRYFSGIWKQKNRLFEGNDRKVLTEALGTRLDLLNLQWIWRARNYYHLNKDQICSFLIPVHFRIPDSLFREMAEADSEEAFLRLVSITGYAGKAAMQNLSLNDPEELYRTLLRKICRSQSRRLPYSVAGLNCYLFLKEEEIHDIVTVVEGIRYRLPPAEIYSYIR